MGERWALRAGEYLVARACRRLPAEIREDRHREWVAELPVILRDRGAGPTPLRVALMLAFAVDTLRGTTLAAGAYRHPGAHRGGRVGSTREIVIALLAAFALLLVLLAIEGWMVYQLIFGTSLVFSASFTAWGLFFLIRGRIRRSYSAYENWFIVGFLSQGAGLLARAVASQCGWDHPLLFAIVSLCGYAIPAACFGVAVALLVRSTADSSTPGGERDAGPPY
jgi:hypothetical protein